MSQNLFKYFFMPLSETESLKSSLKHYQSLLEDEYYKIEHLKSEHLILEAASRKRETEMYKAKQEIYKDYEELLTKHHKLIEAQGALLKKVNP